MNKVLFNIVLFTVAFNLAAYLIAYIDFFPGATLYGDMTLDLSDPSNLPTPVEVIESFFTDPIEGIPSITIPLGVTTYEIPINFAFITVSMFATLLILGKITNTTPIAIVVAMIGLVWLAMLNSSRRLISEILSGLHPSALYIQLIVMVIILMFVIIMVMGYISGQREG
jgi:hypothetical protein